MNTLYNENEKIVQIESDYFEEDSGAFTTVEFVSKAQKGYQSFKRIVEITKVMNTIDDFNKLLTAVVDMIIEVTNTERGFLILFDEFDTKPEFQIARDNRKNNITSKDNTFRVSRSVISEAILKRRAIAVVDAKQDLRFGEQESVMELELRTIMCAPLKMKDKIKGVSYVDSHSPADQFSKEDFEMFEILTGYAASVIEKARLYRDLDLTNKKLKKKLYNMNSVFDTSKALNSRLDRNWVINNLIHTSMGILATEIGAVLLFDEKDEKTLVVESQVGLDPEAVANLSFDLDGGFAKILKQGKPITINQLLSDTNISTSECVKIKRLGGVIAVPMIKKDKLIGILVLGPRARVEEDSFFDEDDIETISTLANSAAIALDNATLYELATTDSLTKVFIRRHFGQRLNEEFKRTKRFKMPLSLIMLDIDHFKSINDTYGHQQGDNVLQELAKIMKKDMRDIDVIARYGGEEFAIILPETDLEGACIAAERLRKDIDESTLLKVKGKKVPVTISIGIATHPNHKIKDTNDLIRKADIALYNAKHSGRNQIKVYSEEYETEKSIS